MDRLPRVTEKNVLILKYYSFENYFLNLKLWHFGVKGLREAFYEMFLEKWKEYLHKIRSGKKLVRECSGKDLRQWRMKAWGMEEIDSIRGHNLYGYFYGRYKKQETDLLERYIELAPREEFRDILDSIERFLYFESRARKEERGQRI